MSLPLEFPPSPFIRDTAELFDSQTPSRILDAGCGEGRNSLYLAEIGHDILGITNKHDDAQAALEVAKYRGLNNCQFIVGDIRQLPLRGAFDIIMVNEVLQQMPKPQARRVLSEVRKYTRQGGLNVISGYIVDPELASATNYQKCFLPGELYDLYAKEWNVLSYTEDKFTFQVFGNQQLVSSLVKLVAQRPWNKS